jgi:GNAT superfamily N-acetyltransferase
MVVWVAEEDGEVVGFITVELDRETLIGEIGNNAVDLASQHRGIGALMYKFVLEQMKEAGMRCATVSTGDDPSHAPARQAYENVGFSRAVPSVQYYMAI